MSRSALVRARSPLRLSFAGGGTDVPSYYTDHGGAVLVSTINRYAYVTLVPRADDEVRIGSLDFDLAVKYYLSEGPIYDGILDLAKAAIQRVRGNAPAGLDLYVQNEAPAGSGLGGSSTLTTAIIGALLELSGTRLTPYEIAELAYTIEREDLKISGGKQDQYAAAFGGFNLVEFSCEKIVVTPIRIPPWIQNDLEYHLMLCYTGKTRLSAGLVDRQVRYYQEGRPETLEGMKNLHRLAYAMRDTLVRGQLGEFAEQLHEAWMSKLKMNPHVTDEYIDEIYTVARQHGALGGKLLGAGGGGYLLLFCEIGKKRVIREKLEHLGAQFTEFSFDNHGLQTWQSQCL